MTTIDKLTERLFSYGTLYMEKVQLKIFNRKLEGKSCVVSGYKKVMIKLNSEYAISTSGEEYHPII